MPLILIKERHASAVEPSTEGEPHFQVIVSIDQGVDYTAVVRDPFSEQEEARLEWYFEEHLRKPFVNKVRAQDAAQSITAYGEDLFHQLFADHKAFAKYAAIKSRLDSLRIEVEGSPAFHALHWEALKDPDLPRAFALECTVVRRARVEQSIRAEVCDAPALRLLIVTARPHGAGDVAYRTISRPLVDALRRAGAHVDIDIIRPGTYRALDNHLQQVTQRERSGFYHIVHFDTHGALLDHAEIAVDNSPNRFAFKRYGRPNLAAYEGKKAFLFFEGEDETEADPVEAGELARLLMTHQIPIAILNACQSGKQVGVSETSLGSRLIEAGVQLVVAMGYAVTVSAAEILMTSLYRQLFDGTEMAPAIRRGRHELANQKQRRAYFNQSIELEDWLLPVVYENQEVKLKRREFTPEEERLYYQRQASTAKEPTTAYGFVGRDLDVLAIERRLLRHNLLLVRGMGGAGKTTLLKHLAYWWQTTDFVDQVFYFGYDEQAWTRQQILHEIAKSLLGLADYHGRFVPLADPNVQQQFLADKLRGKRHLLVLDNLESITGTHLAVAHGLTALEQAELKQWLAALAGGHSLVLLGSRSGEDWLAKDTFGSHIYDLPGLDPEAASVLAERILERNGATEYRTDDEFLHLLKLLAGFPLALEVVLANLARQTPQAVLAGLQAGDINLDTGDAKSKTESILRCIEYSHSNMSTDAQNLLACLAPFSGVLNVSLFDDYIRLLREQPGIGHLAFDRWPDVLKEATNWGLLSPGDTHPSLYRLQPVLPYFLASHLNKTGQEVHKQAIETAFYQFYERYARGLGQLLRSTDANDRHVGFTLARYEYENLLSALRLTLDARASIRVVYSVLSLTLDLENDVERALTLGEIVLAQLEHSSADTLPQSRTLELVGVLDDIARRQLDLTRRSEAKATYLRALDLLLTSSTLPPEMAREFSASLEHQLGIVAQTQRNWVQADHHYQRALAIYVEFNDRFSQGATYHQLGRLLQMQRKWTEAEQHYQRALKIFEEFGDRYEQAGTYHQLGAVAMAQQQWELAEQYYQTALEIKGEFNARYEQASTYHQLGRVAEDRQQYSRAEQYYQEALAIKIEFKDRLAQAATYHQLGTVALEQDLWPQAEQYYLQTLEIYDEFGERYERASALHQLGRVAAAQRRWLQAEEHYLAAIAIYTEFDDRFEQASSWHQLGLVALEQEQWQHAENHFRQALAIYAEFKRPYGEATTYFQLAQVAAAQAQSIAAHDALLKALQIFHNERAEGGTKIILQVLANAWRAGNDAQIPHKVSVVLEISQSEAESLLREQPED